MTVAQFKETSELILGAVDGAYGWLIEAISLIVIVLVFNFFSKWVLVKLHHRFSKKQKLWQNGFVSALSKPLSYYVWFFTILHLCDLVLSHSFYKLTIGNLHLILKVGAIISVFWFCLRWKKSIIHHMLIMSKNHAIALEQSKIDVIDKILTLVILFVGGLSLMEATDRNMNTLIAFGGIGGLAIAFASQEVIANFFGGIMVYATHPFSKNDWIQIPDRNIEGIVEEIGWYMTRVRSLDKRPIYIPNAIFSKVVVITPSRMTHRRIKETLGLRYCDLSALKGIIEDIRTALETHPAVDSQTPVIVNFDAFGSYSLDILVQAHLLVTDSVGFAKAKDELLFKMATIVSKHQAEIANPSSVYDRLLKTKDT